MKKINYGIDAPKVIRNLCIIGILFILLGLFLPYFGMPEIMNYFQSTFISPGICLLLSGILMILYAKAGKFKQRERILNLHEWQGNETVLDVGTGLGLLMIGVAKRLTTGSVYGLDIFNNKDLSKNNITQLKKNIKIEKVVEKTKIVEENILNTSFDAEIFDLIISNLCLHNINHKINRQKACKEIFRILKPGGQVIISDFTHNKEYRETFASLGMEVKKIKTYFFDTFPPLTILIAQKIKTLQ